MANKLWRVSYMFELIESTINMCTPKFEALYYGWVCFSVTVWSFVSQTSLCTCEQPQSIYNKPNVQPRSPWFSSLAFKFIEIDTNINPVAPTSETGTYKLRNQWAGNALFAFYRVNKIQRRTTIQNQRGIKWEMTKISKQQNNDQGMKSYAW